MGWWYAWSDPSFITLMLPEDLIAQVRDRGELWMGSILGWEPLTSAGLMINNLSVAFRAIGGGITAGFFTVYVMFLNGLLIGCAATLVGQNNLAIPFWAFVFPHVSLELPAIFFAGGGGLLLGQVSAYQFTEAAVGLLLLHVKVVMFNYRASAIVLIVQHVNDAVGREVAVVSRLQHRRKRLSVR